MRSRLLLGLVLQVRTVTRGAEDAEHGKVVWHTGRSYAVVLLEIGASTNILALDITADNIEHAGLVSASV